MRVININGSIGEEKRQNSLLISKICNTLETNYPSKSVGYIRSKGSAEVLVQYIFTLYPKWYLRLFQKPKEIFKVFISKINGKFALAFYYYSSDFHIANQLGFAIEPFYHDAEVYMSYNPFEE